GRVEGPYSWIIPAIFLSSIALSAGLFFVFLLDPSSSLLDMYRTRILGGVGIGRARFAGAWNYPYNFSVFFVTAVGFCLYRSCHGSALGRLFYGFLALLCAAMIFFGQARSSIFALFSTIFSVGFLLLFW